MGRKAPVDPCIFCNNLPCTCKNPYGIRAKRSTPLSPITGTSVVVPTSLPVAQPSSPRISPLRAARARAEATDAARDAAVERPVMPTVPLAAAPVENHTSEASAPVNPGDAGEEEVAIFLLKTRLGAVPINTLPDARSDPAFLIQAARTRYEKDKWRTSEGHV